MDTSAHGLRGLFAQLGLENSEQAMADFIRQHRLSAQQTIQDAPFWNTAQAGFIRESMRQDAEWCDAIDKLNTLLH